MSTRTEVLNSGLYTRDYFQNDDVCRLCWSKDAYKVLVVVSLGNRENTKNLLAEKIEDCLNLDLSKEGAPKKVCAKCCDIIESFYDFKQFCCEADRKLNEILNLPVIIRVKSLKSEDLPEYSSDVEFDEKVSYSDSSSDSPGEYNNLQEYLNLTFAKVEKHKIRNETSKAKCSSVTKYNLSGTDFSNSNIDDSFQENLGKEPNQKIKKEVEEEHCMLQVKYSCAERSDGNIQEHLNLARLGGDQIQKIKQTEETTCASKRKFLDKETSGSNIEDSLKELRNKTPKRKVRQKKIENYPPQCPTLCYFCRTNFKTIEKFNIHKAECHGIDTNGKYKCFGCDKTFKSSKSRLGHEISHCKGLKDGYKCAICGRCLPKRRTYAKHMKAHRSNKSVTLPEELFKCAKCYKLFVSKENLTEHKKSHDDVSYVCETCGRRFSRRDYYNKHMMTHQGLRQHACPHCDYKAIQKSSLLVHLRKHSGERPYSCDLCPQRCVSSSNLRAHRQRHLGVKQFECTICSKKFGYKKSLEEHVANTHERAEHKPTCAHCGVTYSWLRGLRRHVAAKHGNTKEKPPLNTDGATGEEF